jgi:hypothetical protein
LDKHGGAKGLFDAWHCPPLNRAASALTHRVKPTACQHHNTNPEQKQITLAHKMHGWGATTRLTNPSSKDRGYADA